MGGIAQASAALLALLMLAPQKKGEPPAALPGGIHELPTPPELGSKIERSIKIGHSIYFQDAVAARGTDVLVENIGPQGPKWSRLGGYLTIRESTVDKKPTDAWVVLFYTRDREPRMAYQIRIWPGRKDPPQFETFEPAAELSADLSRMIRARAAAVATLKNPVQPINPVVLPGDAIGERGFLVYLLAGTKRPDVAVLGRHYRILVDEDGRTVRKVEPLSNAVIEIPQVPHDKNEQAVGLTVSHVVTDWPLETHVFASMLYKVPLFVVTRRGTWLVTRDRIALVSNLPGLK